MPRLLIATPILLLASLAIGSSLMAQAPAVFMPANEIPDLTQTDPKGAFADGGRKFCGPVAVSNSLYAMFGDDLKWEGMSQYDLVNHLASVGYMNTQAGSGTRVMPFLRGVQRFVRDRGVNDCYLKFQGYRDHERQFSAGTKPPELQWIKSTLHRGGAVWLNVGWYTIDGEKEEYRRIGGHWVTAVGYGAEEDGTPNPAVIVIHDPAPRAGTRPAREHVLLTKLDRGRLRGSTRHLERPARGMHRMEGGMHLKPAAHCALLDGAVVLRLPPRHAEADGE